MSDQFLEDVIALFSRLLSPLTDAVESPGALAAFLDDLGWRAEVLDTALPLFADAGNAAQGLADAVEDGAGQIEAVVEAITAIADLGNLPPSQQLGHPFNKQAFWNSLPEDVLALLLFEGLAEETPAFFGFLSFLGVLRREPVAENTSTERLAYDARRVDWGALARALSAPDQVLPEVYGWGTVFDHVGFLEGLDAVLTGIGAEATLQRGNPEDFLPEVTPDNPALGDMTLLTVMPPLTLQLGAGAFVKPALLISALPPEGQTAAAPTGFALSPIVFGSASAEIGIPDDDSPVRLTLGGDFSASPLRIGIASEGVRMLSSRADIDVSAAISFAPDEPMRLMGAEGGTRLELGGAGLGFAISGALNTPEFTFDASLEEAVIYLGAGEGDGLLNKLLGSVELEIPFDTALSWSNQTGFEISGGLGLTLIIPIDKTLANVITLDTVTVSLYGDMADQSTKITATVDGSLQLGPLFAGVEGIGVTARIEPRDMDDPGNLGSAQLEFGFQPPSGYALSLDADPITGGGYISVGENEYRGALALQFQNFGFSAFAILNTELPNNQPGFSFAGSIFGEFSVPLAFGFFLTGVGGFIGINRTIDTDAMRAVLFEGRLDDLLFPDDPIESASQILDDMATIMPPQEGQHIIGPVVRIGWGQPNLIDITMGVLLEFGDDYRVVILGGLAMILPDPDKTLVSLQVQFMGEIDFTAGTISFDATLEGSRILVYTVNGDVAIRTGWGRGITQISSFGGLHPDYPKPGNLPDLSRLSISFGGNNPRFTLSAYQALTYNSLQVGARADMYARGPKVPLVGQVAADGYVAFDALIYFNPFSFKVTLRGGLRILVDGRDKAALHFSLELQGPNTWYVNGEVWVKVLGVKVRFGIEHRWGQRETIQTFTASAVDLLRDTLERSEGFQPVEGTTLQPGVTFRQLVPEDKAIDPLGGLRFVQNTVPLAITLEKIGEAEISGPATIDIKVYNGSTEVAMTPAEAEFVRGHFFSITKSQRLSDPVFEDHKAGFQFSDTAMASGPALVEDEYDYEIIEIPLHDTDKPRQPMKSRLDTLTFARVARGQLHGQLRPMAAQKEILRADVPVELNRTGFLDKGTVRDMQGRLDVGESLSAQVLAADRMNGTLTEQRADLGGAETPVASYIVL